jgi:hypothetical protein
MVLSPFVLLIGTTILPSVTKPITAIKTHKEQKIFLLQLQMSWETYSDQAVTPMSDLSLHYTSNCTHCPVSVQELTLKRKTEAMRPVCA